MSTWSERILAVIRDIPWTPYGNGFGVSENIVLPGLTLRADDPPESICSGAQAEAFLKTLQQFPVWSTLTKAEAKEIYRGCYARADVDSRYCAGLPGVLVDLGAADIIAVENVSFGDPVQISWHADVNPAAGHAVIAVQIGTAPDGTTPALWCWSSNISRPKFDLDCQPMVSPHRSGHQTDYFVLYKPGRRFSACRMRDAWLNRTVADGE